MLPKKDLAFNLGFAIESKKIENIEKAIQNIKKENFSKEELKEIAKNYKEYLKKSKPGLLNESGLDIEEYKVVFKQTGSEDLEDLIDTLIGL